MSEVAMCDSCLAMFAVGEEGSQRLAGVASETDSNGRTVTKNTVRDLCGVCANVSGSVSRRPRAISAAPARERKDFIEDVDGRGR